MVSFQSGCIKLHTIMENTQRTVFLIAAPCSSHWTFSGWRERDGGLLKHTVWSVETVSVFRRQVVMATCLNILSSIAKCLTTSTCSTTYLIYMCVFQNKHLLSLMPAICESGKSDQFVGCNGLHHLLASPWFIWGGTKEGAGIRYSNFAVEIVKND